MQRSVFSAVESVNAEKEKILFLCRNATVHSGICFRVNEPQVPIKIVGNTCELKWTFKGLSSQKFHSSRVTFCVATKDWKRRFSFSSVSATPIRRFNVFGQMTDASTWTTLTMLDLVHRDPFCLAEHCVSMALIDLRSENRKVSKVEIFGNYWIAPGKFFLGFLRPNLFIYSKSCLGNNLEILINDEIIFGVKSLNVESLKKEIPCQNKFRGATLFSALKQTHRTEHTWHMSITKTSTSISGCLL